MVTIGEAARRSGVTIETIRYYEREGIVPHAERSLSGRRQYDTHAIATIRFIRRCRDLGFSIADARALLTLSDAPSIPCEDAAEIGARHLRQVRNKLAELQDLEDALGELLEQCRRGRAECPILRQLRAEPHSEGAAGQG